MGRLIDADKFLKRVEKDRKHEIYMHSWTADMVLERLNSWYAPTVEAIPKDQYEARLKADMLVMLEELKSYIELMASSETDPPFAEGEKFCADIIQEKIDKLKEAGE